MSIIIILSCQKLGSVGPVQQKSKLPSPNVNLSNLENVLKRSLRTDREYIFGGTTLIMYWLGGNHGGAYVDSIYVRVCPKQNSGYITERNLSISFMKELLSLKKNISEKFLFFLLQYDCVTFMYCNGTYQCYFLYHFMSYHTGFMFFNF